MTWSGEICQLFPLLHIALKSNTGLTSKGDNHLCHLLQIPQIPFLFPPLYLLTMLHFPEKKKKKKKKQCHSAALQVFDFYLVNAKE